MASGALTAATGQSPRDKFFAREPTSQDKIWWYPGNQPIGPEKFDGLLAKMLDYIASHQVFVQDCSPAPTRATGSMFASSPSWPCTASSRTTSSSGPLRTSDAHSNRISP